MFSYLPLNENWFQWISGWNSYFFFFILNDLFFSFWIYSFLFWIWIVKMAIWVAICIECNCNLMRYSRKHWILWILFERVLFVFFFSVCYSYFSPKKTESIMPLKIKLTIESEWCYRIKKKDGRMRAIPSIDNIVEKEKEIWARVAIEKKKKCRVQTKCLYW